MRTPPSWSDVRHVIIAELYIRAKLTETKEDSTEQLVRCLLSTPKKSGARVFLIGHRDVNETRSMTYNRRGPQAKHGSRLGARLGILLPTLLFSPLLASPHSPQFATFSCSLSSLLFSPLSCSLFSTFSRSLSPLLFSPLSPVLCSVHFLVL